MAQKGGTYRVPAESKAPTQPEPTLPTAAHNNDQIDDQQWEVVKSPEEPDGETDRPHGRWSSHFDITLGWGKWKVTVLSWDVSGGHCTPQRTCGQCSNDGHSGTFTQESFSKSNA